jgi:hypothetical protein
VTDQAITTREKRKCAERELALRRNVYPKFIAKKSMTQRDADWQIALMEAIVSDYRALEAQEKDETR